MRIARDSIWFPFLLVLAASVLPLLGPGCTVDTNAEKVIRVTRNIGGREGFRRHFELWKATFEKRNPGWVMELIDLGNAEGAAFYKSRIATDDLPEVVMTWQMTNFLSDGGHLVPLPDSYYEKFGIPLPEPYKGKRYTSQGGLQIQGVVVNKDMWDDIGVTGPPATWDAWFAAFHKLEEKGHKALVLGGREWSAAMPMYYGFVSDMYDRKPGPAKPLDQTARRGRGTIRLGSHRAPGHGKDGLPR